MRKRLSERERLTQLKAYLILCFELIGETDPKEVTNMTGLHPSTILRLMQGGASLMCRYNTIDVIGRAAGYKLVWRRDGRPKMVKS